MSRPASFMSRNARRLDKFYLRAMKFPEMAVRVKDDYAKAKELPTADEKAFAIRTIKEREISELEELEKELGDPSETPEQRRRRQFFEIQERVKLTKVATVEQDREWARRHFYTEPWRVSIKDVPARSSVVCLLLAIDDPTFRRSIFTVEKQPPKVTDSTEVRESDHNRFLRKLAGEDEGEMARESAARDQGQPRVSGPAVSRNGNRSGGA